MYKSCLNLFFVVTKYAFEEYGISVEELMGKTTLF